MGWSTAPEHDLIQVLAQGTLQEAMKAPALQHLSFLDLAAAPDSPGLYAWYGTLSLSPADYRDAVVGGVNQGPRRLRQSLARHTARFDPRPRRLSARSEFGGRWRGELHDTGRAAIRRLLLGPSASDVGIDQALETATSSESLRRELVSIRYDLAPESRSS
jgi:hypothetical protein